MVKKRIRDLLTDEDRRIYRSLTKDLMLCSSDEERRIVNNKIADLIQSAIERNIPKNDEQAAAFEHKAL